MQKTIRKPWYSLQYIYLKTIPTCFSLREYDFNKEIDLHWSIFTCSFAPVLGARWQCKYNMQLIIVCPKQKLKQHFSPLPHHHFSSNQKTMSTYLLFWEKPLFLWHHKHSTKERKWIVLHHKEIFIPSYPYLERQDKGLTILLGPLTSS